MGMVLEFIDRILTDNSPAAKWLRKNCREEWWCKNGTGEEIKTWVFNGEIDGDCYLAMQVLDGKVRAVYANSVVTFQEVVISGGFKRSDSHREAIFWMMGFLAAHGIKS